MNNTIHKFAINPIAMKAVVRVPRSAEWISVGQQNGDFFGWARVSPNEMTHERELFVIPTGAEIPISAGRFLGRIDIVGLVFHVFTHRTDDR